jgi:hypothetical protein
VLRKTSDAEPFAESKRLVELAHEVAREGERRLSSLSAEERERRHQQILELKKRAGEQFQNELIAEIEEQAAKMTPDELAEAHRKTREIAATVRARSGKR